MPSSFFPSSSAGVKNWAKSPKVRIGSLPVFISSLMGTTGLGGGLGRYAGFSGCLYLPSPRPLPRGRSPPRRESLRCGLPPRRTPSLGFSDVWGLSPFSPAFFSPRRGRGGRSVPGLIIVNETRRRSLSTSITQILTMSPTAITSCGSRTNLSASRLTWTRPLSCMPMSTNAPKSTTFNTVPVNSMPWLRSSSFNTPFLKIGVGRSSRGSRPGRPSWAKMSFSVSVPAPSSLVNSSKFSSATCLASAATLSLSARSAGVWLRRLSTLPAAS